MRQYQDPRTPQTARDKEIEALSLSLAAFDWFARRTKDQAILSRLDKASEALEKRLKSLKRKSNS